jgi:large conductance mechanosensitive channel
MVKDFRDFLLRGNVIDLAVAVVIGGAFAAVVASFVTNILTPLLGLLGLPDLSTWSLVLPNGTAITYGLFLNALIYFVLVALAIYLFVVRPMKAINERRMRGESVDPATKTCTECATEIPAAAKRCPNCTQPQP